MNGPPSGVRSYPLRSSVAIASAFESSDVGLDGVRPVEHVLEDLGPFRVDAEVEHAALEDPPVGDRPPMLFPEPCPPERLAAGVLEAPPREVSNVLCPCRPTQAHASWTSCCMRRRSSGPA